MKKIFILSFVAVFFSVSFMHAQIQKGNFLLGGSLGFSTAGSGMSSQNSNASISPRIGYAVGNNSVLYAKLGYSGYKTESPSYDIKSNALNAGISWKRFFSVKEKLGLFTDLYGIFSGGRSRQESGIPLTVSKTTSSGYTAGLTPGIYYMPASWLVLNVDAGGVAYSYTRNKTENQPSGHTSVFNVNLLSFFNFGVDFILNKRKS